MLLLTLAGSSNKTGARSVVVAQWHTHHLRQVDKAGRALSQSSGTSTHPPRARAHHFIRIGSALRSFHRRESQEIQAVSFLTMGWAWHGRRAGRQDQVIEVGSVEGTLDARLQIATDYEDEALFTLGAADTRDTFAQATMAPGALMWEDEAEAMVCPYLVPHTSKWEVVAKNGGKRLAVRGQT